MNSGQLCAIKDGLKLMPMWLADNWAFHDMVKALLATTHLVTVYELKCFYAGAISRPGGFYQQGTGTLFNYNINCNGNESRLTECSTTVASCTHSNDAGLECRPTRK